MTIDNNIQDNNQDQAAAKVDGHSSDTNPADISAELKPLIQLIDKRKCENEALKKILNDLNKRTNPGKA